MGAVFECHGSVMKNVLEKVEQIQDILQETYSAGNSVLGDIQSKTAWTGGRTENNGGFSGFSSAVPRGYWKRRRYAGGGRRRGIDGITGSSW